jgi:predicted nuclease of predicted toxin-antitoxin system
VKLLLDECVPARLARFLTDHSVITFRVAGWAGIKNAKLLPLAEKEFDVFATVDRKISTQEDLTKFNVPVLLLRAQTNRLEDIRPLAPELLKTLGRITAGTLTTVGGEERNENNSVYLSSVAVAAAGVSRNPNPENTRASRVAMRDRSPTLLNSSLLLLAPAGVTH